jgi:putative tryptophan/tyrosine transport system substrate-binding protein
MMSQVRRRQFLRTVGAGSLLVSLPALAQQKQFRIGWISSDTAADGSPSFEAFRQGLSELGYVEGRNLVIAARWGDGSAEHTDQLVAELVRLRPDVIVTLGPAALSVRKAGSAIPVVFGFSGDPLQAGFVDSLSRPGGNLTGISFMTLELVGKRIELLKETLPRAKRLAIIANPQHPGDQAEQRASHAAAKTLGLADEFFEARNAAQLETALNSIAKSRADAMVVFPTASLMRHREQIAAFATKHRIPAISGWAQFAEGGNLMSYGPNLRETFRRLAFFTDKILKGVRPSDIPVELPTQFELVINLKTAKALGIKIPQSILVRVDRVIE